ncbi:RFX DNA-binding domain-containing protein [Cladophialophora immunda]|nr:RFX DNA-binding domain-containing protein [Cladophialophora immunda]
MAQSPTHPMEETPDQQDPTHPNNASNRERQRPKSRGSTTSLQSIGVGSAFQPSAQQHPQQQQQPQPQPDEPSMPLDQNTFFMQHGTHPAAGMYGPNPEEMLMHYQHNMPPHLHQQPIDPNTGMPQHEMRPMSQQAFQEMQHYPMQYPHGLPPYAVAPQHMHHMRHHSEQFEGSPAPEDSNNENGGAKRRKGTASSVANDQELRRLLAQYQAKVLKKSPWKFKRMKVLGANLRKQNKSLPCFGSKKIVNVLQTPYVVTVSSFGKLVRIIFPNVQTRRLGVRGESKYHYVDLSLIMDDDDRQYALVPERPGTSSGIQHEKHGSVQEANKIFKANMTPPIDRPMSRATMETADFPAPSAAFLSKEADIAVEETPTPVELQTERLDCKYINTPTIRFPVKSMPTNVVVALPSIRRHLPASMATYLGMPTLNSLSQPSTSSQDTPIDFPDINPYLEGENYDASIAKALFHLYRSYCIDVIDAFRKCKEKPFFNHHSAFNGKMTVPVSKLFSMPCLAPWIQECDMRMYKQIVRFIAPLAIQNVPEVVWNVFDRIGSRLVSHLISAFEEKCPVHVIVAKIVPAARFVHVLKKLKGANAATLQLSRMLEDPQQRTQMWLDLMSIVDPDRLLEDSMPPPESLDKMLGVLKHDMRPLVDPIDDALVHAAEEDAASAYATFINGSADSCDGILVPESSDEPASLLERWINWLERLPQLFDGHHPQCMINWHTRLWRSVMMQMGQGGAHSYQSWCQKLADDREQEKRKEAQTAPDAPFPAMKRKRAVEDVDGDASAPTGPDSHKSVKLEMAPGSSPTLPTASVEQQAGQEIDDDETDAELDELRRGGPLDLPSFHTGLSSPVKHRAAGNHDDSGIDLGLDVDVEAEKEASKFNKRDWLLSSDPADPAMGLVILA